MESFCSDLSDALAMKCNHTDCNHSIDNVVGGLYDTIGNVLDQHAPITKKVVVVRGHTPWMNDEIFEARRVRRRAEICYRHEPSDVRMREYRQARNKVVSLIASSKRTYYNKLFNESSSNPKALFRALDGLLKSPPPTQFESFPALKDLPSSFLRFFKDKVIRIRNALEGCDPASSSLVPRNAVGKSMLSFRPIHEAELSKIISSSRSTTCAADPMPTELFKACIPSVLTTLTSIVNSSLASGTVPASFKIATIKPLLKKANLDGSDLSNYRPISTLPFLSKVLERVVLAQLLAHLDAEHIMDPMQSAYRTGHSTETAMVRVQSDILQALDRKQSVILVLLDLSAAFDTVDHAVLVNRLSSWAGISGTALRWITNYLAGRKQRVLVDNHISDTADVQFGVPQGSVLGPVLFSLYMLPLKKLLDENLINYHMYADDVQLYLTVDPSSPQTSFSRVEQIVGLIKQWMSKNFLMLNRSKTEVLLISSRLSRNAYNPSFDMGDGALVSPSPHVRDLGAYISANMTVDKHISMLCRSASFSLRNLGRIRKFLTVPAAHSAARALILSRLDYHNALLWGAPEYQLQRLQRVQNMTARLVLGANRRDPSMPILSTLHWLPIEARVKFKICVFTYRAVQHLGPLYLQELLQTYHPSRTLRSRMSGTTLEVPRTRTAMFGDRAFSAAAPRLWNSLPEHLRSCSSETQFRRLLKTHLFKQYFH